MDRLEIVRKNLINQQISRNLTQKEVANMSDISFDTYRKIESGGRKTICVRELWALHSLYDETLSWYFSKH